MKISVVKRNITPKFPTYIGGHSMRDGLMKGVHDEIEAVISWLEIDEEKYLFVNADLSNFDYDFIHEAKRRLLIEADVKYENIIISASHTHSGPVINTRVSGQPHSEEYRGYVMDQIIDGSVKSYANGVIVSKVTCKIGESQGYYGNRNSKDKYGDQSIYVFEFWNEEGSIIASYVNMACHATVLSPEEYLISSDLIGELRRKLTNVIGVEPMMMNGSAGDISTRLYRNGNDFEELERVTSGIASEISSINNEVELYLENPKTRTFRFNVQHLMDIEELKSQLLASENKLATSNDYDDRKWLISQIAGFKRKIANPKVDIDFETTIIRMNDLEIVVVPCELVSAFGKQIKRSSNAKVCIIWGYANGQAGYVVEASEFDSGHDGITTTLPKGKAEEYVSQIIQNLF